jgi:hypothetical protein
LVLKNERNDGKCSVPGCHSKSVKKGLCDKHYNRRRIHGDENFDVDERGISLKKRIKRKIIKSGDGCWEWQGFIMNTGYGRLKVDGCLQGPSSSYEAFFGKFRMVKWYYILVIIGVVVIQSIYIGHSKGQFYRYDEKGKVGKN